MSFLRQALKAVRRIFACVCAFSMLIEFTNLGGLWLLLVRPHSWLWLVSVLPFPVFDECGETRCV